MEKSRKNINQIPELITLKETCELLKVHPNTLRAWDKKGILRAVRFGEKKIRRYRKSDIVRLIEQGLDFRDGA